MEGVDSHFLVIRVVFLSFLAVWCVFVAVRLFIRGRRLRGDVLDEGIHAAAAVARSRARSERAEADWRKAVSADLTVLGVRCQRALDGLGRVEGTLTIMSQVVPGKDDIAAIREDTAEIKERLGASGNGELVAMRRHLQEVSGLLCRIALASPRVRNVLLPDDVELFNAHVWAPSPEDMEHDNAGTDGIERQEFITVTCSGCGVGVLAGRAVWVEEAGKAICASCVARRVTAERATGPVQIAGGEGVLVTGPCGVCSEKIVNHAGIICSECLARMCHGCCPADTPTCPVCKAPFADRRASPAADASEEETEWMELPTAGQSCERCGHFSTCAAITQGGACPGWAADDSNIIVLADVRQARTAPGSNGVPDDAGGRGE